MVNTRNIAKWVGAVGLILCVAGMVTVSVTSVIPPFPVLVASLSCGLVGLLAGVVYVDSDPSETPLGRAADKLRDPKFRSQLHRAESAAS